MAKLETAAQNTKGALVDEYTPAHAIIMVTISMAALNGSHHTMFAFHGLCSS